MLTKAGAKLLDFGLAKIARPAVAIAGSMAPTTPPSMTAQGVILGTFQYMAPEQIEGIEADARTDIFAFGAVVFEMLTGRSAFEGKTRASLLGAILKDEPPPVSRVRPDVPAAVARVVSTCLAKEPDDRWQTARDLLRELRWVAEGAITEPQPAAGTSPGSTRPGLRSWQLLPWAVAGVLAAALTGALVAWAPWHAPPRVAAVRFEIVSTTEPPTPSFADRPLAISSDGARFASIAGISQAPRLAIRSFERLDVEPLRGVMPPVSGPFFSPDGRWVGFFGSSFSEKGVELRKVSVEGGASVMLCLAGGFPRGATWLDDGTIVFATTDGVTGLLRVSADGGDPQVLTKPASGGRDHLFPSAVPGRRAVLFTIGSGSGFAGSADQAEVAVLDLETGQQKTLLRGASSAQYVETSHLLYATAGSLRAVRFDRWVSRC